MNKISVFFDHLCVASKQSGISVEQVLSLAKGWGIDMVEINCLEPMVAEHKDALLKSGMGVSCVCSDLDFINDNAEISAQKYAHAFDVAQQFNCDKVLCIPGFFDPEGDIDAQFDRVCERLGEMVCAAKKRGITVAVEDFDHRNSPCCSTAQLKALTDRVAGLKIAFDCGNFSFAKEDIATAYSLLKDDIVHIHLKDRGLVSAKSDTVAHNIDGEPMYSLAVGDGELDLGGWIGRVLADGYSGALTVEHFGLHNQLGAIERSAEFVRRSIGV